MFAGYSRRGDRTYARMAASRRVGGVVARETSNLGRVVDRERHVFRSRERGTSALDPKGGEFGPAPPVPPAGVPGVPLTSLVSPHGTFLRRLGTRATWHAQPRLVCDRLSLSIVSAPLGRRSRPSVPPW